MDNDWLIPVSAIVAVCAVFAFVVWLFVVNDQKKEKAWELFAAQHNCRVVGVVEGVTATGISSSGKVVTVTIPERTTYKCDGDFTVTR